MFLTQTASGPWATAEVVEFRGRSVRVLRAGVTLVTTKTAVVVLVMDNSIRVTVPDEG